MKRTELSRITAMAQTDQPQRRQSPKTPTSPTIEQLLRGNQTHDTNSI